MPKKINLIQDSPLWDAQPFLSWKKLAAEILTAARQDLGLELSKSQCDVILGDDVLLHKLNAQFRGKDKPTNVLSFPSGYQDFPGEGSTLGEIYVSYDTLSREAHEQDKQMQHHFQHMLMHGFLHLLGYDHETDEDAQLMEAIEIRIMTSLGLENPYGEVNLLNV